MATGGPTFHRSVTKQKRTTYKSNSVQTADVTCRCRGCKKTLCQFCKNSPKKLKLLKGKRTDDLTDPPEAVSLPSVVSQECGSSSGSRYWDVHFSEYFTKNFKKVLEIKVGGWCCQIKVFKQKIWAPLSSNNVVELYNKNGNIEKTIDIKYPRSVDQADNGDIFIACPHNSGLYVIDDNEAPQKICEGSFTDVYAYRDKVYALEYKKQLIMEFCSRRDTYDVKQRWRSEKEWTVYESSHCDRLIVTGDKDLQFYVSHRNSHKLSLYNTQGQCIKDFVSKLFFPRLCGIDRQSHLLVADFQNNMYNILDLVTGQWSLTGVRGEFWVFDAALDDEGNLWMSQSNRKENIITKHEPQ